MKTILNLTGVKPITNKEQTHINGSSHSSACYQRENHCCQPTGGPRGDFYDAGNCRIWGCVFY